ncbi:hypothetical protein [Parerythrobacter lacustris]|uniref:Uncharacterized protein n=1 Tax=Parerythrobacter lacustris TaxID=2969984 RepID=A0ABT1XNS4_9SPHN|nr:hypothetical protein [Parerythrobacter lacustris]MCR2833308.1 hypothetical protein [Parerythrobacter lacustris]
MTNGEKRERPLYLDMDPDEALERFMQTDPAELKRRLDNKKPPPKRGPGAAKKAKPSG